MLENNAANGLEVSVYRAKDLDSNAKTLVFYSQDLGVIATPIRIAAITVKIVYLVYRETNNKKPITDLIAKL